MKAIQVREFGGPEVMRVEEVPDPKAGRGEVVVRIHAAGVNPVDAYILTGTYPRKPPLPYTPGLDGGGVVESVGEGVTRWRAGDRVYVNQSTTGTYAQKAVCPESGVHPLPGKVSFAQGAALGVPYATAFRALFQRAHVQSGETVFIHGASGGVGIAAVQLARAFGMRVIGTAGSERGRELVLKEGAHEALDHKSANYLDKVKELTGGRGPDVILEMLANVNLANDLNLLALRGRDQLADSDMAGDSSDRLVESARRRLLLFGLTPQQITALQKTGEAPTTMTLHAPISGNIITRYVTQGDRIEPGTKLLDIAELSRVWVLADIYEYELPFVRLGQVATMTLSYLPGRTFEGRITFIYPTLSEATRTVKVRLEFSNPDFALKPEMYAQVEIRSDLGERLSVPESAVISTGTRDIAFVDRGEGYFEPRELKVGMRLADRFEVLDGVAEGEQVLTSGNFLVDSESKLKAALAAAGTEKAGSTAGHTH